MIKARWFTPANRRNGDIDLIVIHDMEASEKGDTAERIAEYFSRVERKASAHWCFDNNSAIRCVLDKDVAYHAPGANHNGLGYEHAGFAKQSGSEWLDDYGMSMLDISARQAAKDCLAYDIPIQYVDRRGLAKGQRGITTHNEVSQAFKRSSHWDPGPGFPMAYYIGLVKHYAKTGGDDLPLSEEERNWLRKLSTDTRAAAKEYVLDAEKRIKDHIDAKFKEHENGES
jgi:hypothetical protein